MVAGSDMNYFTPWKFLDSASCLFNNKVVTSTGYYATSAGNLTTAYNLTTGAAQGPLIANDLKLVVKSSSVVWNMKNVSQRTVLVDIWECTPILKYESNNPLNALDNANFNEVDTSTQACRINYVTTTGAHNVLPMHDGAIEPQFFKTWKFSYKKRTMQLAPDETCTHSIKGFSGVIDYGKLFAEGLPTFNGLVKGMTVSCLVSVRGDLVVNALAGAGGRLQYLDATNAGKLSCPIAIEVVEYTSIECPEVAGFTTIAGAAGTQQLLNNRKPRVLVANYVGANNTAVAYNVANPENPLLGTAGNNQYN